MCPDDGSELKDLTTGERPDPVLGQLIDGRFRVEGLLGRGGFGAVYRAVQTSVGRPVALKFLHDDVGDHVVKRFMREARATSQLRNVHTVTLLDFGRSDDGRLYLAMELLEGESLAHRLRRVGPLPWPIAMHVVAQVAESLEEAHGLGIVHRDLKPENIFLTRMGGDPDFVKVLDFGIAKIQDAASQHITRTGSTVGTPAYMSPEHARQEPVDQRADIYALGIVLFEMLTGTLPFTADSGLQLLLAHCQLPVPRLSEAFGGADVPAAVEGFMLSLLDKDPDRRLSPVGLVRERANALRASGQGVMVRLARDTGENSAVDPMRQTDSPLRPVTLSTLAAASSTQPSGQVDPPSTVTLESLRPAPTADRSATATPSKVVPSAVASPAPRRTLEDEPTAETPPAPRRTWMFAAALAATLALGVGAGIALQPTAPAGDEQPLHGTPVVPDPTPAPTPEVAEQPEPAVDPTPEPAEPVADPTPEPVADPTPEPVADPTPEPVVDDPEPVAPPPEVIVVSKPPGATVRDADGEPLGKTPLTLPGSDAARKLKLKRSGYRTKTIELPAGASGEQVFTLSPIPTKSHGKAADELMR